MVCTRTQRKDANKTFATAGRARRLVLTWTRTKKGDDGKKGGARGSTRELQPFHKDPTVPDNARQAGEGSIGEGAASPSTIYPLWLTLRRGVDEQGGLPGDYQACMYKQYFHGAQAPDPSPRLRQASTEGDRLGSRLRHLCLVGFLMASFLSKRMRER